MATLAPVLALAPLRHAAPSHAARRTRARAATPLRGASLPLRRAAPPQPRRLQRLAAAEQEPDEPERDEDGLYIGTYSNFFSDPSQIRGVAIFCVVLASFFSLGNVGAAIVLPLLCVARLRGSASFAHNCRWVFRRVR